MERVIAGGSDGVANWFPGLVVVMPVLGHAIWHAYRDLVQPDGPGPAR